MEINRNPSYFIQSQQALDLKYRTTITDPHTFPKITHISETTNYAIQKRPFSDAGDTERMSNQLWTSLMLNQKKQVPKNNKMYVLTNYYICGRNICATQYGNSKTRPRVRYMYPLFWLGNNSINVTYEYSYKQLTRILATWKGRRVFLLNNMNEIQQQTRIKWRELAFLMTSLHLFFTYSPCFHILTNSSHISQQHIGPYLKA